MTTRTFTEDQFCDEAVVAGFLGAFKFWRLVLDNQPFNGDAAATRDYGEGVLRGLAQVALRRRGGRAIDPQEYEAFRYCGLEPRA
jgi:hypothetical protein